MVFIPYKTQTRLILRNRQIHFNIFRNSTKSIRMSDQQKEQQFDGDEDKKEEGIRSIEGSEWSVEEENIVGHGNAKLKEEINPKIALLEVNNL
jgi:hypothetical protein